MRGVTPSQAFTDLADRPAGGAENLSRPGHRLAARDGRSDELKAAAIIAVVCIHSAFPYASTLRFCLPVFVAMWAFHYERGLARRSAVFEYAGHRFIRLLIPYLFWTAIYVPLFHFAEMRITPWHTIVGGWLGGYGWAGQYFFIILFQLNWLFPFLRRLVTRTSLPVLLVLGGVLNVVSDYLLFANSIVAGINDRLFLYWIPYACLGIACARGFPAARVWLLLPAAVLLAAQFEFDWLVTKYALASASLLAAVTIGSIALLLAVGPRYPARQSSMPVAGSRALAIIHFIGRNSFPIFVCHVLVLEIMRRLGVMTIEPIGYIVVKAAIVMAAIGGSLGISWILQRCKMGIVVGM